VPPNFLHLRQSTLSRCVRALEEELKVLLFERSGAGVMPAAAGAPFITSARRVICEVNTMPASQETLVVAPPLNFGFTIGGAPYGNRTRVSAVKGSIPEQGRMTASNSNA
jgi:DNA-binding transcriptional LysR family regulator